MRLVRPGPGNRRLLGQCAAKVATHRVGGFDDLAALKKIKDFEVFLALPYRAAAVDAGAIFEEASHAVHPHQRNVEERIVRHLDELFVEERTIVQ